MMTKEEREEFEIRMNETRKNYKAGIWTREETKGIFALIYAEFFGFYTDIYMEMVATDFEECF